MKRSDPNILGNDGDPNSTGVSKNTRHGSSSPQSQSERSSRALEHPHNSFDPFQGTNISLQDIAIARDSSALTGIGDTPDSYPNIKDLFSTQATSNPYESILQRSIQSPQQLHILQQHILQQHLLRQYRQQQQQQDFKRHPLSVHSLHGLGPLSANVATTESGMIPFMNPSNLLQGQNLLSSNLPFTSAAMSDLNFSSQALGMAPVFHRHFNSLPPQDPSHQTNNTSMMNPRAPAFNLSTIDSNTQALLQMQQLHFQQLLLQQAQLLAAATAAAAPLSGKPSSPHAHESSSFTQTQEMKRRKVHEDLQKHQNMMHLGEVIKPKKKKKDKLRPKRPLSAYNLFFRAQREVILNSIPTPSSPTKTEDRSSNIASIVVPSMEEDVTLDDDSESKDCASKTETSAQDNPVKEEAASSDDAESNKKRPHRKIGFEALAKVIGQRWRNLKEDDRQIYGQLAIEDMKRYKDEMEVYLSNKQKGKVNNELEGEDDE